MTEKQSYVEISNHQNVSEELISDNSETHFKTKSLTKINLINDFNELTITNENDGFNAEKFLLNSGILVSNFNEQISIHDKLCNENSVKSN